MAEYVSQLQDAVSVKEAARRVGMNHNRARAIIKKSGIGIPWGGRKDHPRLRVKLSEFEQAILSQRYSLPGSAKRKKHKRTSGIVSRRALHPDVKC